MSASVSELVRAMRSGDMDPKTAVDKAEAPAILVGDIPIDEMAVQVLDCGFPTLNEYMFFKRDRGELLILGARPSMGKSAFLFQTARNIAVKGNVLVNSLEMDKESIKARMLADLSGLGLQKILKGEAPRAKLEQANRELQGLNLYIDDRSGLDVSTLAASALAQHKRTPLSLLVVDYLQLVKSGARASRSEEVGDVSMQLKLLAKQLKCPVLVAAQLNRKCVERGQSALREGRSPDYKPEMGDLRESGNIEQDADGILFLSRHEAFAPTYRVGQADIVIAKQRNGPTGCEIFTWLGASTRFRDPKATDSL